MKIALKIVYITLFVKLLLGAAIPFFFDESYYWYWGRNLQLSYYDHPPVVSWLYAIGQMFNGLGQASRWPGIFMSQASVIVWLYILKDYIKEKNLVWFSVLMAFWPLFGFTSIVITPDIPFVFFWSLSVLFVKRSLDSPSWKNYLMLGLSLGLGGASKYLMILFIPCLLIYLTWAKLWNRIEWSKVPAIIFMGLLGCSPVLIWNYQHNWESILFQIDHGLGESIWKFNWTTDYVFGQILLIFPPVLWFAIKVSRQYKLLSSFAWFPILFFVYSSTKGQVEANWPIMAYPAIGGLAILGAHQFRWLKWSSAFWALLSVIIFSNAVVYWLPTKESKLWELHEYMPYKKIAQSYQPMYATSFQMAAYLTYISGVEICKLRNYRRRDFYDYLDCSMPKEKRYYLLTFKNRLLLPEWAKDHKKIQTIPLDQDHQIFEMEIP